MQRSVNRSSRMKTRRYDLVVLGGGFAGVAAAVQGARDGLRVAILERTTLWGGLATSGLVTIYMPLDNGLGRQVSFGLAEELLYRTLRYGPGTIPAPWINPRFAEGIADLAADNASGRYMTRFAAHACVLAMDEILTEVGADLWVDTLACLPVRDGRRIEAVEVENKSGRTRLEAAFFIDATGDADIAFRAGVPCREHRRRPCLLALLADLDHVKAAAAAEDLTGLFGGGSFGDNEHDVGYDGDCPPLFGGNGREFSRFVLESRRYARGKIAARQRELGEKGRKRHYPALTATLPDIRMTRDIEGVETIEADMKNRRVDTSVGMIADNRQRDAVWEVPYGALVGRDVDNLYVVGRCASATGYAWQVSRLIQAVVVTGQAGAAAAALCIRKGTTAHGIDVRDVQARLEGLGFELHL
ncbi:MAG: FAD-dependent oxidoreductase [Planctomycetes bacterium]|nr:FAD-dependent oxidoreductase [Planctomycetota bacterium]